MLSAREYVEIMTCKRLYSQEGDEAEYKRITSKLNNLIYKMARLDNIQGFTPEDLEGFFHLKVWQETSKQRNYKNEFSYFARSFQNIIRNLVRDLETAKKRLPSDPLDDCTLWDMDR